jgi:hypothetical protein
MRRLTKVDFVLVAIAATALIMGGCGSDSGKAQRGAASGSQASELKPPPDFDRNDPEAVRRAVVDDLKSLEKAGILIGLVDSRAGRVRVLVEELTPAKKQVLQERYGPLLDVEIGTVRPVN